MTITFGNVKHPTYEKRPIDKPEGNGWDDLGQRIVRGVTLHRMLGTLRGTDGYFRDPSVGALTDYGVGDAVTGFDAAADDGNIFQWNDPRGHRAGWASGPVSAPYNDGKAFIDKYGPITGIGVNVVNRDRVSIEISGNYDSPLTEKCKDAIAHLMAYWADQQKIPWDSYPNAPGDNFSSVCWHQEFTIGTGKICPGPVVMDATDELIARAKDILKAAQTSDTPPTYAPPSPIAGAPRLFKATNGKVFIPIGKSFTLQHDAPQRQYAVADSAVIGPALKKGTSVAIAYSVLGDDNKQWFVTSAWARLYVDAFLL